MNTPQTPAATTSSNSSDPGPKPSDFESDLSPSQAATMATSAKDDLAAGKITEAQANTIFAELNTPIDQRGPISDTRTSEHQALDAQFPVANPQDYALPYFTPGQAPPVIPQEVKQHEAMSRTLLHEAGFSREHGNALANTISRVLQTTHKMSHTELQAYGEAEFVKLQQAFGPNLDAKLQSAARMIDALEKTQPGAKALLKSKGIGDSALVVSALIQQAERWEIRHKR